MGQSLTPPSGGDDHIQPVDLKAALEERYLAYALSTIMHRALPDVRDGLKPVHRRIVHAMSEMGLRPNTSFKKCARIVGDVMGKFHPHGDASIYDALVRLSQEFAIRYPLVDGQGNFGNIDGDNAAAMRYTEAKMTDVASLLLEGIDQDAVDFRPTYNEEDQEPAVLPGAFPNLLANGATGIAVGMATSIPPHNAHELCDAALHLIRHPEATVEDLLYDPANPQRGGIEGPDFPTGGIIVESRASMAESYRTGRGGFRVRARWVSEELGRGGYQIVITEIPYQVKKADLVEQLADLIETKKAALLGDVRDESAEDVRLVLEPKNRNVEPEVLMESLFKLSALETRFPVNMNVLDARGSPGVMGLRQALQAFLDHRREVLVRRARFRLDKIEARLHILDGLVIAFLNLDEVIRIVRYEDEPKAKLIEAFELSDIQADAILNTRLRQLAKLEEMELRREHAELAEERDGLLKMLASDKAQWKLVGVGLKDVRAILGPDTNLGKRRSIFDTAPVVDADAAIEAMIVREPITVILSERGWIRAAKGKVDDPSELKFKEGDKLGLIVPAETTDKLLIFASDGRFFTIGCDKLPGARGHGEPLRLMLDLDDKTDIIDMFPHKPGTKRVIASKEGYGFILPEEEAVSFRRAGKQVLNAGAKGAAFAMPLTGDYLGVIGDNGKVLIFPLAELPEMPRGKGVKLQTYREGGLRDAIVFKAEEGATWIDSAGRTRVWGEWRDWLAKRAAAGKLAPKGFPASKRFKPK